MGSWRFLVLFFGFCHSEVAGSLPPINVTVYHALRELVRDAFGLSASYGTYCYACDYGHTVGSLVRLPFHDAAGVGDGPNGCLDFTTDDNANLIDTKSLLDTTLSSSAYAALISKENLRLHNPHAPLSRTLHLLTFSCTLSG